MADGATRTSIASRDLLWSLDIWTEWKIILEHYNLISLLIFILKQDDDQQLRRNARWTFPFTGLLPTGFGSIHQVVSMKKSS